jgi:hypothetical protein
VDVHHVNLRPGAITLRASVAKWAIGFIRRTGEPLE